MNKTCTTCKYGPDWLERCNFSQCKNENQSSGEIYKVDKGIYFFYPSHGSSKHYMIENCNLWETKKC